MDIPRLPLPGRCEAQQRLLPWQAASLLGVIAIIVYAFVAGNFFWRTFLISCWIALYTFNNVYRYWLAGESLFIVKKKIPLNPPLQGIALAESMFQEDNPADEELPAYTILLPLRHEADVVAQLMSAIVALDYPRNKLQVLCLLRRDDAETLAAIEAVALHKECDVIPREPQAPEGSPHVGSLVPRCAQDDVEIQGDSSVAALPQNDVLPLTILFLPEDLPVGTKPAACNWGLLHATGEILVIYDAEDIPEPGQLRDAAALLKTLPDDVAGVQSAKKVYNGNANWLTRLYELEALTWHHLQLPGIMAFEKMAPLHGSGVHLRTKVLLAMNGWDYYNVAEDCDLGVRLQRHSYRIVPFDSPTGEEAPSTLRGWMGQRTRWNKGYIQSFLVHWRNPLQLWRELGSRRVLAFATLTGITWLNLLIGLPTWIGALAWSAIYRWDKSTFTGTGSTEMMLLIGSAIILLLMAAALQAAGAVVMRQCKLVPYGLLAPFYWVLLGIAVWRSLWQLCVSPFGWEKTKHGQEAQS